MTREWHPGDVAMVECSDGEWRQATCEPHSNYPGVLVWRFPDRVFRQVESSSARRLMLIDLPPGALAGWPVLIDALRLAAIKTGLSMSLGGLADQIEQQDAPPKPPKPEEPQGLGAVVEAINDNRFVRTGEAGWVHEEDAVGEPCDWRDIDVVRVLSEGVTP